MIRRLFERFGTLLRHLTTARDNQSPSLVRIFTLAAAIQFVWLAAHSVFFGAQPFDPMAYGGGFGLMITGFGVALRVSLPANAGNDPPPPAEGGAP